MVAMMEINDEPFLGLLSQNGESLDEWQNKSLQDNSVDSEKQTEMQGKEVKKEKVKKIEEEMQNQTSEQENQGLDGVYPWLQKLTATCTRFIIFF